MYYTYILQFGTPYSKTEFELLFKDVMERYGTILETFDAGALDINNPAAFGDYNIRSVNLLSVILSDNPEEGLPFDVGAVIEEVKGISDTEIEVTLASGRSPDVFMKVLADTSQYLTFTKFKEYCTYKEWNDAKSLRGDYVLS